jgi:hypothetical protein
MSEPTAPELDAVRAEAAAEERAAILEIIERCIRQLVHGHGVTGAQALQHVIDLVEERGAQGAGER